MDILKVNLYVLHCIFICLSLFVCFGAASTHYKAIGNMVYILCFHFCPFPVIFDFILAANRPYWWDLRKVLTEILDLLDKAMSQVIPDLANWVKEEIKGPDPVKKLTGGALDTVCAAVLQFLSTSQLVLVHIQIPPDRLRGSHITQYHCGYCMSQYH